jgi:hypothetical protein
MAKTTVHGGPSDIMQEDPSHPAYMPEEHECLGTNSSTSKDKTSNTQDESDTQDQPPARTTENHSPKGQTGKSTARTTGGSGKADR